MFNKKMKLKLTKAEVKRTIEEAKETFKVAKPKIKKMRKFSAKRGMRINQSLARPVEIKRLCV